MPLSQAIRIYFIVNENNLRDKLPYVIKSEFKHRKSHFLRFRAAFFPTSSSLFSFFLFSFLPRMLDLTIVNQSVLIK